MKNSLIILTISLSIISCSNTKNDWYENDVVIAEKFAYTIDSLTHLESTADDMLLGGFSGYTEELLFVNYLMAGIGYGQIIMHKPELKDKYIGNMEYCIDKMINDTQVKSFDSEVWGEDPIQAVMAGTENAHGAYLCYLNVALSMHHLIDKNSKYRNLNKIVSEHLIRKIKESEISLIESYPDDYYPADISASLGSIGLYSKATGIDLKDFIDKTTNDFNTKYRDDSTGLVFHQIANIDHEVVPGEARGASTAFSAYFLSFVNPELALSLFKSIRKNLYVSYGLIAGIREYPKGVEGIEDGDSGPIVMGLGVSATGFSLSLAKKFRDEEMFSNIYGTASRLARAETSETKFEFKLGARIGNSIMFAMLTAN